MSFMDNLKRSLGYEETETAARDNKESALDNLSAMINNLTKNFIYSEGSCCFRWRNFPGMW